MWDFPFNVIIIQISVIAGFLLYKKIFSLLTSENIDNAKVRVYSFLFFALASLACGEVTLHLIKENSPVAYVFALLLSLLTVFWLISAVLSILLKFQRLIKLLRYIEIKTDTELF